MKSHSPARVLSTGAILALVVVAWVNLGPRQLGGSVSYVITHGVSMQPRVHEGDLVILRRASRYGEGEVIAYDSPSLGRPVMHRIVDRDERGYITKGDNNDWVDTDRPTDVDVLGKEWVHIPGAGKALRLVATPPGAAAVAGVLGLLLFAGTGKERRRQRKGISNVNGSTVGALWETSIIRRAALVVTAVLAIASVILGIVGFTREPVSSLNNEAVYTHTGEFAYSADAEPGPVYRDGSASTGEPLFINLIDTIDFSFTYRIKTEAPTEITGRAMLWARVSDDSGWKQALRLQEEVAFGGDQVALKGTLDPRQVQDLVSSVQQQTGVVGSGYTVTLLPTIVVEGSIDGRPIEERYTPTLDLTLDGNQLELTGTAETAVADASEGVDPLRPRQSGSLETSKIEANTIALAGAELPVEDARRFALLGLLLAAAAAFWLWFTSDDTVGGDEVTRIQSRYGRMMVPVKALSAHARHRSIEVADMDGLLRLAEHYDRMIMHEQDGDIHRYFVEDDGVAYVFQPGGMTTSQPASVVAPEPVAAPEPVVAPEPVAAVTPKKPPAPRKTPAAKATVAKATTAKTTAAKTTAAKTAKKATAKAAPRSAAKPPAKKVVSKRTPKPGPEATSS